MLEDPASGRLPKGDMSRAAGGPQCDDPSGTPLAPQLTSHGGGSPHLGGGGSRVPAISPVGEGPKAPDR